MFLLPFFAAALGGFAIHKIMQNAARAKWSSLAPMSPLLTGQTYRFSFTPSPMVPGNEVTDPAIVAWRVQTGPDALLLIWGPGTKFPSDWPADDLDPKRVRCQGTYIPFVPGTPLVMPPRIDLKLYNLRVT